MVQVEPFTHRGATRQYTPMKSIKVLKYIFQKLQWNPCSIHLLSSLHFCLPCGSSSQAFCRSTETLAGAMAAPQLHSTPGQHLRLSSAKCWTDWRPKSGACPLARLLLAKSHGWRLQNILPKTFGPFSISQFGFGFDTTSFLRSFVICECLRLPRLCLLDCTGCLSRVMLLHLLCSFMRIDNYTS